jgi:CBS domain-containing protein
MSVQGTLEGSYLTPSFDKARVSDAMRAGVVTCQAETPLTDVARMMATHHIHSVVVTGAWTDRRDPEMPWGVLTDLDLMRAGPAADDRTAGMSCAPEVLTVKPDDSLERARELMVEHHAAHVLVVDSDKGRPVGVLSTLDLAGIIAWGRG